MASVKVIGFLKLREGVTPEEYETWLKESDYPVATTNPSLLSMQVFRVEAAGPGPAAFKYPLESAPAQYVEILEFTSLEEVKADLRTSAMREIFAGFQRMVKDPVFVCVEQVV